MVHPIRQLEGESKLLDIPIFTYKNGEICKEYRYGGPRPSRLEKVLDDDLV
jgi:hypothetical protein